MVFPKSKRVVFAQNPLEQVVCQIRFPSILKISRDSPVDFQERVRELFPHYGELSPPPLPDEAKSGFEKLGVNPNHTPAHQFLAADRKTHIILNQDFIAVTAGDYRDWEGFSTSLYSVLDAFVDLYRPASFTRVGLRYVNIVNKVKHGLEAHVWPELLGSEFVSMFTTPELDGLIQAQAGEIIIDMSSLIEEARVAIRYGLLTGNADEYVVDADFFTEEEKPTNELREILASFNVEAGNLFRWVISDHLRDALGERKQ